VYLPRGRRHHGSDRGSVHLDRPHAEGYHCVRPFGPGAGRSASQLPSTKATRSRSNRSSNVTRAARAFDEHLLVIPVPVGTNEVTLRIVVGTTTVTTTTTPAAPADAGATPPARIRVGGNVQQTKLVSQPLPVYPPDAKQARIQGVVKLNATIAKDGTIQHLEVISGHPLLIPAALDAVRQWVYEPTLPERPAGGGGD